MFFYEGSFLLFLRPQRPQSVAEFLKRLAVRRAATLQAPYRALAAQVMRNGGRRSDCYVIMTSLMVFAPVESHALHNRPVRSAPRNLLIPNFFVVVIRSSSDGVVSGPVVLLRVLTARTVAPLRALAVEPVRHPPALHRPPAQEGPVLPRDRLLPP